MRNKIIHQIHAEMKNDKSIFFLTADMGINLVENIQNDYPDRFLNVGIAEHLSCKQKILVVPSRIELEAYEL